MTDKTRPQCEVLAVDVGLWNRTAMFPCNLTTLSEFKTLSPVSVHQSPMGTGIRCLILGNLSGWNFDSTFSSHKNLPIGAPMTLYMEQHAIQLYTKHFFFFRESACKNWNNPNNVCSLANSTTALLRVLVWLMYSGYVRSISAGSWDLSVLFLVLLVTLKSFKIEKKN